MLIYGSLSVLRLVWVEERVFKKFRLLKPPEKDTVNIFVPNELFLFVC